MEAQALKIKFEIEAGKFDGGMKNCKYCNSTSSAEQASIMYQNVVDYPWATLTVFVEVHGYIARTELLRNYSHWRDVWHDFNSDTISWSEAFDRLMSSECGMSKEEALECLATHFDRRPVLEAQDA